MKLLKITENDANQRLDKFLKKLLPNSSLSLVYKINRKNKIKVNGKREDNEYKIQIGDEIKIFLSDSEFDVLTENKELVRRESSSQLSTDDIVYEDSSILVINKSPGIIVHPGDFKTKDISLIQQVHDYLGGKLNSLTFKPSLVHRIDKDTSGIILIAKTKMSLDFLLKDLQSNKIEKYYLAIVLGEPEKDSGIIDKKLLRIENAKAENKIQVNEEDGQKAITHYKVIQKNIKGKYSLIECKLETGRMHQIRVHLASIGCPVLGDKTYGNSSENSFAKINYGIQRQLLHAYKVVFTHPEKRTKITLEARLKDDMKSMM
ncbi:MAG: RluA family pseudouridine synthase [Candidatus Gracilibacteria bacterium]|nr:RluA family pseudouridine synthase [Candidatus Gracilibacteria bacterium]MDD2909110.1 RluA family pseudouridine synthase [Candidatus Gracilibacteria bacterium]